MWTLLCKYFDVNLTLFLIISSQLSSLTESNQGRVPSPEYDKDVSGRAGHDAAAGSGPPPCYARNKNNTTSCW